MSRLLSFASALLAIAAAAYFDIVRDAPISAAILAAVGFALLVVIEVAERWNVTYSIVSARRNAVTAPYAPQAASGFHHNFDDLPGTPLKS